MRKLIPLVCLMLPFWCLSQNINTIDSTLTSTTSQLKALKNQVDLLTKQIKDSARTSVSPCPNCKSCPNPSLGAGEVLLIMAPILLFLLALWLLRYRLKKANYKISDALSTFRSKTLRTVNRTYAVDGNQTSHIEQENTTDEPVRSASRLIAFLTAIVALIIAIVITSYIGYQIISGCGQNVSLDSLWKILIALGIGVIPYGANVLNGNNKEDSTASQSK